MFDRTATGIPVRLRRETRRIFSALARITPTAQAIHRKRTPELAFELLGGIDEAGGVADARVADARVADAEGGVK